MEKYGDPEFKYHKAMAQLFGVLLADLVDSIVLPFGATEYADALDSYLSQIESRIDETEEPASEEEIFALRARVSANDFTGSEDAFKASLLAIHESLASFRIRAEKVDQDGAWANQQLEEGIPWWNIIKKIQVGKTIARVNVKYKYLERQFLYEGGLDGRSWFKHVVYAPGLWTGYSGGKFSTSLFHGVEFIVCLTLSRCISWAV